jgi:hypothetical protein
VFRRLAALLDVQIGSEVHRRAGKGLEQPEEITIESIRDSVNFNSIASGQQHNLGKAAGQFQAAASAAQMRGMNRQFFADLDRCRLKAHPRHEEILF